MNELAKLKIDEFIAGMTSCFPALIVSKDLDECDGLHMFWHNYKNYKEHAFMRIKIELIEKLFHDNDLYNIGFSYTSTLPPYTV